ncbi:MAG: alpha/beta hydrolase [Cyanobacteria bacterium J06597_1]
MIEAWSEYIQEFRSQLTSEVREGCHPLKMLHGEKRKHSIVLIHGLTDSPHYMKEIGRYFYETLGFNVLIPLLQAHGLSKPRGMKDVSLDSWKHNVRFSIEEAQELGEKVSIGGLSTGGALSVWFSLQDKSQVTGGLFLFSAALDLAGKRGELEEFLLRTPYARWKDRFEDREFPLIGDNPYRYDRMDKGGATELSKLIRELDKTLSSKTILETLLPILKLGANSKADRAISQKLFVAHSEADEAADITAVEDLIAKSDPQMVCSEVNATHSQFFRIAKQFNVSHASLVLKDPVFGLDGSPLEAENPFFDQMMDSIRIFVTKYLPNA